MADASEALQDMFDALHACFAKGEGVASIGSQIGTGAAGDSAECYWSESVVSQAFGLNVKETSECSVCNYRIPSQRYTRCFQMVTTDTWIREWLAAEESVEPEVLLRRTYEREWRCSSLCSYFFTSVYMLFVCEYGV